MSSKQCLKISRRRFLAGVGLGATGIWMSSSDALAARVVRGFIAETSRGVARPKTAPDPSQWSDQQITIAWLGHATVLINFYGLTILTDPVLFRRIGARSPLGTIGPKRLIAPALTAQQLPHIDLVLLSHAHLDHLDIPSLRTFSNQTQVITARKTGDLFRHTRLQQVHELGWDDHTRLTTAAGSIHLQGFQVNHWGARWRTDKYRGYNGYILEREGKKIIFGGDTAMTDSFGRLKSQGPFELAVMPIGSYRPWRSSHCTPEEALAMTNAAGAKFIAPVHFSTFVLGREGPVEPIQRLNDALQHEPERVAWQRVGDTFPCDRGLLG